MISTLSMQIKMNKHSIDARLIILMLEFSTVAGW